MGKLNHWGRGRVEYYLGALANYDRVDCVVPERSDAYIVTKDTTLEHFTEWRRAMSRDPSQIGVSDKRIKNRYKGYVAPVVEEIRSDPELADKAYLIIPKDNPFEKPLPILVKSRPVDSNSLIPLMQLDRARHWRQGFRDVEAADIPFEQKQDRLVFRGTATGRWALPGGEGGVLASRWHLARRIPSIFDPRIDVAFTRAPSTVPQFEVDALVAAGGIRDRMTVEEQLQCKYLLSLEGHDVASGLKWMLRSNSVVLMPRPRVASWLMEDKLAPFKHYVPLAHDLSDLEEKVDWCQANQDQCRAIAEESTARIEKFLDEEVETDVRHGVYAAYSERVKLIARSSVYAGVSADNLTVAPEVEDAPARVVAAAS